MDRINKFLEHSLERIDNMRLTPVEKANHFIALHDGSNYVAWLEHSGLETAGKMEDDPCWDGYEMVGVKDKDGKQVPNCVPQTAGLSELQKQYRKYFRAVLKDHDATSPASLDEQAKKKFFLKLRNGWRKGVGPKKGKATAALEDRQKVLDYIRNAPNTVDKNVLAAELGIEELDKHLEALTEDGSICQNETGFCPSADVRNRGPHAPDTASYMDGGVYTDLLVDPIKADLFISGLLHSATFAHFFHLATGMYSKHVALQEYYEAIPGLVDSYAESYQGKFGVIPKYPPITCGFDDPIEYFVDLQRWVNEIKPGLPPVSDLNNIVDEIVTLIDQTRYKLQSLS